MNKRLCSPAHRSLDSHHPKADPLLTIGNRACFYWGEVAYEGGKVSVWWTWQGLYSELDRFLCLLLRSNKPALRWVLNLLWWSWSHNVPGVEIMPISWAKCCLPPFSFTCTLAHFPSPSRILARSCAVGCTAGHCDKCCPASSQQV